MNAAALFLAVAKRLAADTGAGGLFAPNAELVGRVYENFVPGEPSGSFLVLDLESMDQNNTFRTALYPTLFRVNVWVPAGQIAGVNSEASRRASAIVDRVRGDWVSQGGAPTYGLHKHALTLEGTDVIAMSLAHTGSRAEHEDGYLHFVESYRVYMQEAA